MDTGDSGELECRVCRCGPEDDRPLCQPCLCSGSIGLVHQSCLETWLAHSNKDKCELCSTKYVFVPEYASDTPSIVPLPLVIKSAVKLFVVKVLPMALKIIMAVVLWLLFVPLWTSWVYRIYFREQTYKDVILARSSFHTLKGDIISGLVIIGVILLSSIILMSFADFVRLFWGEGRPHPRNRQRNHHPAGILANEHIPPEGAILDIPNEFGRENPRVRRVPPLEPISPLQQHHVNPVHHARPVHHANAPHVEALRLRMMNRNIRMRNFGNDQPSTFSPRQGDDIEHTTGVIDVLNISSPSTKHAATSMNDDFDVMDSARESIGQDVMMPTSRTDASMLDALASSSMDMTTGRYDMRSSFDTMHSHRHSFDTIHSHHKQDTEDWTVESENSWSTVSSDSDHHHSAHPDKISWKEESDDEMSPHNIETKNLPPADPSLGLRRRAGKLSIDQALDQLVDGSSSPSHSCTAEKVMNMPLPVSDIMNIEAEMTADLHHDTPIINQVSSEQVINDDHMSDVDDGDAPHEDEDWIGDLDENNGIDPVGADVEVRFALDELLGLRGPHFTIVKHVIWFLTFTGLYLFVFVFFPVSMGSIIVEVVAKHFPILTHILQYIFPRILIDILLRAQRLSEENKSALCLSDLALTIIGYFTIYTITTCWHHIMSFIRKTMISSLDIYVKFLDNLVIAGKIGALLSVRIFLLPLTLGLMILTCFNVIFQFTIDQIVVYLANNLVGCLTFAWTIGITYMLVITLSVLQLREILHPEILSKNIRPQETHSELLQSLVNESGWVHFRRLILSMMVYLVLLVFVLFIPFLATKSILTHILHMPVSEVRVWYFIPELQLPLEVAMGHFTMLTVLEGKKNYIGRFLYIWISFISKKLHVTRFVLPCPMKRIPFPVGTPSEQDNMRVEADGQRTIIHRNARGNIKIGPPLRRPPPGWDARNHDHQVYDNKMTTRWAWGGEEPSTLEANVAPRVIPNDWLLKTILMVSLSWMLVSTVIIFLVIVPVSIGREIFSRLCLPHALQHDPIAFFLGIIVCYFVFSITRKISKCDRHHMIAAIKRIPFGTLRHALELALLWNITHIGLKLIMMVALKPTTPLVEIFTLSYIYQLWSSYRLMIDAIFVCFVNGGAQFVLLRLGQPDLYGIALWCQQIRLCVERMADGIMSGRFDEESLQLKSLRNHLIWPFFDKVVVKGVSIVAAGWISAVITSAGLSALTVVLPHTGASESLLVSDLMILAFFNRLTTSIICLYCIVKLISQPVLSLHQRFYQAIKDENYLTGRKLQNVVGRM